MLTHDFKSDLRVLMDRLTEGEATLSESSLQLLNDILNKLLLALIQNKYDLDNYIPKILGKDLKHAWDINKERNLYDLVFLKSFIQWTKLDQKQGTIICGLAEYVLLEILHKSVELARDELYADVDEDRDDDDLEGTEEEVPMEVTSSVISESIANDAEMQALLSYLSK